MFVKRTLAIVLFLMTAPRLFADAEPAIIPQPVSLQRMEGEFAIVKGTRIFTERASAEAGAYLARQIRTASGLRLLLGGTPTMRSVALRGILITTNGADASLGDEGYELTITTNLVSLKAPAQAGLFYGVQTILQLLPPEIYSQNPDSQSRPDAWRLPCVKIVDQPRFKWRGLMLDVSRHFFTKDEVKQLLDAMAMHKINTLHWHLTDDQGWRIEIKKYPKLTEVGAWRGGIGFGLDAKKSTAYGPDGRYGGFYTQDDIREVVAYATKLHITIVPEIEMPGHSMAALASYPEYGTGKGPFVVPMQGGVNTGIYSPANEKTFEFLDDVLTEVFQLFPGKLVHIGGDEVPKEPWKKDPACQELMKREGLKNEEELQSWFIRRIEKFVNSQGRTLIGWSEILQGGLAQNADVMDWIGGGKEAASKGHDVVMTPTSHCYFDHYQSQNRDAEPRAIGGYLSLARVYSLEPVPKDLPPEMEKHILGAQGNVWTEYIPNMKHVEYMVFPRLAALSEVTWSPKESRNYANFMGRLKTDYKRLDASGVNYREEKRIEIGEWKAAQIATNTAPLEWELSEIPAFSEKASVTFDYLKGKGGIRIDWVALLEDGVEISRDTHDGFAAASPTKSAYALDIPAPKPGAKYTIRARAKIDGGGDSSGMVFWESVPASK